MTNKNNNINNDSVVILIPAYNEASVIKETINNIQKIFNNIVCVNDGSSDNTEEQILSTRAELVSHTINLGQGAALQTAIDYALHEKKYKYFVTYDADGQHNIEDVITMLDTLRLKKLDIVLGSRFLGHVKNPKKLKIFILKFAVGFTNITTGLNLTDTHNGLRVFNRYTAENLKLQMPDFAHASEILDRISDKKLRYEEVPVTITYTGYSQAKGQSMINAVNIVFDVLLSRIIKS